MLTRLRSVKTGRDGAGAARGPRGRDTQHGEKSHEQFREEPLGQRAADNQGRTLA